MERQYNKKQEIAQYKEQMCEQEKWIIKVVCPPRIIFSIFFSYEAMNQTNSVLI